MPDIVQTVREAVVAILDSSEALAQITQRSYDNIVPIGLAEKTSSRVIGYFAVVATPRGGVGDQRRVLIQFSAYAESGRDDICNAMLEVVENEVDALHFSQLDPPLYAWVERDRDSRRPFVTDATATRARGDLDRTIVVRK